MFHRVVDSLGENRIINDGIEVTTNYLEFLISFYKSKGFKPISINEIDSICNKRTKERYVIFSFDDGYRDNLINAFPIFEKHQVPFVIYIPVDFITRKQFAWWYYLEDVLSKNTEINFTLRGKKITKNIFDLEQKKQIFTELRTYIQEDNAVLKELMIQYPPVLEKYHNLFLNVNDLKELSNSPLATIGSHSISHPSLAKTSFEQVEQEIFDSKKMLEKMLEFPIEHFSFPFGTIDDVTEREIALVKKAGYKSALTTSYGDVKSNSNIHQLPRIWTSNQYTIEDLNKIVYGVNEYNQRKNK